MIKYDLLVHFLEKMILDGTRGIDLVVSAYSKRSQAAAFFDLELSSQVQQRIEENLKRGLPAEAFARSTVEFGNEGCYLSLAEVLHINRLGTVFTD